MAKQPYPLCDAHFDVSDGGVAMLELENMRADYVERIGRMVDSLPGRDLVLTFNDRDHVRPRVALKLRVVAVDVIEGRKL